MVYDVVTARALLHEKSMRVGMTLCAERAVALVRTALSAYSLTFGQVAVACDFIPICYRSSAPSPSNLFCVAGAALWRRAVYPHAYALVWRRRRADIKNQLRGIVYSASEARMKKYHLFFIFCDVNNPRQLHLSISYFAQHDCAQV